jgi:radical SAM superfamily enzyme YgiQ (UPF0313 family)
MKILLIAPDLESKFQKSAKGFNIPYPIMFSTSGLQILAALTPDYHDIKLVDEAINEKVNFDEAYDLVGITVMTTQSTRAYKIAKRFRDKGVKVVMGGYHVSYLPDEALEHCDAVCIGEGEKVWQQMLLDAENNTLKQKYMADELIDLSEVPWPKRVLASKRKAGMKNFIQTSRGCPYQCSFCSIIKFFGNTYRFRPVEDVVAEIRSLKEKGQLKWNFVFFSDDNICGDPNYAKDLFRALIPLKIKWGSQCSITIAKDEELLDLARRSGCIALAIGLESISDESLVHANKRMGNKEAYENAIKRIHSYKIGIFGLFIFGFDSDDKSVFESTFKFVEDNYLEYAMFSILTPIPGTSYFNEFEASGRLLHKNWADYDFQHVVFQPKNMTVQELQDGRYYTAKRLHSFRSIFKRLLGARTNLIFPFVMNLSLKRLYYHLPKI